jgi:Uma2 family endonuclease
METEKMSSLSEKFSDRHKRGNKYKKNNTVPHFLIYETLNRKPVYYKNFQQVIQGKQTAAAIMGSGKLQTRLISLLLRHLFQSLPAEAFEILTNETGLHLDKSDNVATDISIFDKKILNASPNDDKYIIVPPLAVIEIDTQADTSGFTSSEDYYYTKTQKLLDFGVQEVIWYLSHSRKIIVARQNQDWITMDWHKEVTLLGICTFSLTVLMAQNDITL